MILSMWVAWQLLFGPGSERLTYGIIAPMAAWALLESLAERRHRILSAAAWAMTAILGTGAVERALLPYFSAAPAIQPAGVVVFAAWLLARGPGQAEERGEGIQERPLEQRVAA
jgi:hypothetical protein